MCDRERERGRERDLGDSGAREGVGLHNVRARLEIPPVDLVDDVRAREREEVVVPLQVLRHRRAVLETRTMLSACHRESEENVCMCACVRATERVGVK